MVFTDVVLYWLAYHRGPGSARSASSYCWAGFEICSLFLQTFVICCIGLLVVIIPHYCFGFSLRSWLCSILLVWPLLCYKGRASGSACLFQRRQSGWKSGGTWIRTKKFSIFKKSFRFSRKGSDFPSKKFRQPFFSHSLYTVRCS